ncbi:hypothetical protein [Mariprofundus ferrooxydans]|uniref:hypothetical protein n=1 Tax=Mariprofundus ferrooxydans TaxID=314344 RepID=UPI0014318F2C|nr:hypothetical protein [Mariprofundus ferrooxydans]
MRILNLNAAGEVQCMAAVVSVAYPSGFGISDARRFGFVRITSPGKQPFLRRIEAVTTTHRSINHTLKPCATFLLSPSTEEQS